MTLARDTAPQAHLNDYVKILRKHRYLVAGIFLVTVVTTAIWTFIQTPIYQGTATVLIEPEPPKVLNIQDVSPIGSPTQDYYRTQYEIIRSRPVITKTMETLNLRQRIPAVGRSRDAVRTMLSRLTVEPVRNTRLVLVRFDDPNPQMAAEVANGIANAYAKYNLDVKLKAAHEALTWLTEQMNDLKVKVEQSSEALQSYRVKAGILGLQEQRQITAQKIMDFNKAYLEAQAQRLSVEAKLKELTQIARDKSGAQTIFTVADSPLIQKLKADLAELEVQRSKLLKVYKEKHPEVQKVEAQIAQVQQRIDGEIQTMIRAVQTEYKVAKAREDTLLGNVMQLRKEGQDLNEKEIQYQTLQRDADSNQQLYEAVLKRLKETGVTGGLDTNNIRVVEEAVPPRSPIRPRRLFNLVLSLVIGAVAGVGLALTIEYLDTTVKSPDDVERTLGLPVIGIVPLFGVRR